MSKLYYFMGGSGSGKDSILQALRTRLAGQILVAPRYITRPFQAGGENHIEVSDAEFQLRQQLGLFALHWQANSTNYGIGQEIYAWLELGTPVFVNGSRSYFEHAKQILGNRLQGVWIHVDAPVLQNRLIARGRETTEQINQRMARHRSLDNCPQDALMIDNSGKLNQSVEQFMSQMDTKVEGAL